ncbi:putative lipase/esterase [Hypoxylon trugodes]|uniref:putative lipase/esterase n=1 Tax=Hypoxylon trugodes TaxID=326681 RepID=UPI00219BDE38|nr:putative lipase/esterase [Hypoxylon trugodes]KAI1392923.1 putative lipase/esterase [Hypoxylon trugodes]
MHTMAPRTEEELLSYSVMDPIMVDELSRNPVRDPQPSDPYYGDDSHSAARAHRATTLRKKHHLRYLPGHILDQVSEEDRKIPVRDGSEIIVRIYRPVTKPAQGSPLIVMYHEGGFSMGDLSDEETNCRLFSRDLGAVCVNVDYRLAPEYPFPTWIEDSWDALKWAAQNATSLGADPSLGFIIGGGSAGGNIAAVLAHIARDEKLSPPLTGQYLCVPTIMGVTPPNLISPSYRAEYLSHPDVTTNVDPVLKMTSAAEFALHMHGNLKASWTDPRLVPFLYGGLEGGHRDLPPAYFQLCGIDPLRDEGLIYERVLREEAGVKTRLDLYKGFGHYFWTNWPQLERSRQFVEDTVKGVKWLLEQKS